MKDKKAYLINSLKSFGVFCLVYFMYKLIFTSTPHYNNFTNNNGRLTDNAVNLELIKVADSLNKKSYVWIDSITEFIDAQSLPNKILQYNMALKIDTNKYYIRKIKEGMEKEIFDNFIMTQECKGFRDNEVTIIYNYIDMKSHPLFKLTYSPDTYKK